MMLRLLLSEVFPDGRASVPWKAVDLTTLQREVLNFLASGASTSRNLEVAPR